MENDFDIRRDILLKYKGSEKDVIIPDGVTAIDEKAFRGCETLESVVIPDTVISIRWGAFSFCKNLRKITIPSSVEFISVSAIEGCTDLTEIVIQDSDYFYVKDGLIHSKKSSDDVIGTEIVK